MSLYLLIPLAFGLTALGWVAGMWTRGRANHWCGECGAMLACPDCRRAGTHQLAPEPKGRTRRPSTVDGAA